MKYVVPCPVEDAQQVHPKVNLTPFSRFLFLSLSFLLSASVSQPNMHFKSQFLPVKETKREISFEDFSFCKVSSLFVASFL